MLAYRGLTVPTAWLVTVELRRRGRFGRLWRGVSGRAVRVSFNRWVGIG